MKHFMTPTLIYYKKTKCAQNSKWKRGRCEAFFVHFYSVIKNFHAIYTFFGFDIFVFLPFQNLAAVCVEPRSFQSCFRYFHPTIHSRHLPPTTVLHNSNFINIFFPLKGCYNCWHKHNDEDSIIKIMLMRNTTLYVIMCLPKSEYSV